MCKRCLKWLKNEKLDITIFQVSLIHFFFFGARKTSLSRESLKELWLSLLLVRALLLPLSLLHHKAW